MKLYVDLNGDRHYLMTDDGEAVYVDDLQEDGRDSEYLDQTIEAVWRRPRRDLGTRVRSGLSESPLDVETFGSDE